jgi:hypothetical protein
MVAPIINSTGLIGQIILSGSNNITGSVVSVIFIIIILLIAISILFQIPFELLGIFLLPLILVISAYEPIFITLVVLFVIYYAWIITKSFIFR